MLNGEALEAPSGASFFEEIKMIDKREGETKKSIPSEGPLFEKADKVILPSRDNVQPSQKKAPRQVYDN